MPQPESPETAHERIVRTVRQRIERGDWPQGTAVPSEAALGREFAVARGTIRAALQALQEANLIVVVPAKGRYVAGPHADERIPARHAQEIAAALRTELSDGTYGPGDRFLSEAALRERFNVSRYTAKLALAELSGEGAIVSVHGRGHFVPEDHGSSV